MSVTVDHEPLPVKALGLQTVGQVINHVQKDNRLVVQVLIDGQEPNADQFPATRQTSLADHVVYIETADPRELAVEVLDEVRRHLEETDRFKAEAAELLQRNQTTKALQQLSGCLRVWQHAQESVEKTAELLRIDLQQVRVGARSLTEVLQSFSQQLRQIRSSLHQRDFVLLGDVLLYEMQDATPLWLSSIDAMRELIRSIE